MFNVKITVPSHQKFALDAVKNDFRAFDFSKIAPLPDNHEKMEDGLTIESLCYFLTDRLTKPLSTSDFQHYLCNPNALPSMKVINIKSVEFHTSYFMQNLCFTTDSIFESGKALAEMIDKHGVYTLAEWNKKHWGQELNSITSQRIDDHTVIFSCQYDPTFIIKRFKAVFSVDADVTVNGSLWGTKA